MACLQSGSADLISVLFRVPGPSISNCLWNEHLGLYLLDTVQWIGTLKWQWAGHNYRIGACSQLLEWRPQCPTSRVSATLARQLVVLVLLSTEIGWWYYDKSRLLQFRKLEERVIFQYINFSNLEFQVTRAALAKSLYALLLGICTVV